jgi:hypothetical protein
LPVAAVCVAPRLGRAILVSRGQPDKAHHRGLQRFDPGRGALPRADRMHPTADRDVFAGGGWGLGLHGHGHVLLGRHHQAEPGLVQPPPIPPVHNALITDHLGQTGVAGQVGAGRRDQGPPGARFGRLVRASITTLTFPPETVTSRACAWPRGSVRGRWRVLGPPPSYGAVVATSVAATRPVRVAAHPLAWARARMTPVHKASR